ncbi:flagellin [Methylobacterium sp. M6A4_1b]
MSSGITLTAATRQNLLSLQGTADLLTQTQNRLSTGKKVNSALDDPTSFFTSQSLTGRSGDLGSLLNGISNGVQTIQAANQGITSIQKLVDSAKSTANQALADKSAVSSGTAASAATVSGTKSFAGLAGSATGTQDFSSLAKDGSIDVSIDGGKTSTTIRLDSSTLKSTTGDLTKVTADQVVSAINSQISNSGALKGKLAASVASDGRIAFSTTGSGSTQSLSVAGSKNSTLDIGFGAAQGTLTSAKNTATSAIATALDFTAAASQSKLTVSDGFSSYNITLDKDTVYNDSGDKLGATGSTHDANDIASAIQLQLKAAGSSLTVTATSATGSLVFTSQEKGSDGAVSVTGAAVDSGKTAVNVGYGAGTYTTGTFVAGTAGTAATGLSASGADATDGSAKAVANGTVAVADAGISITADASFTIKLGDGPAKKIDLSATKIGAATASATKRSEILDAINKQINADTGLAGNVVASFGADNKLVISSTAANAKQTITVQAAQGATGGDDIGFGTQANSAKAVTATGKDSTGSTNSTRTTLSKQFNEILNQITQQAKDSSYNGINLLYRSGDDPSENSLKVTFNETGTSSLSISGAKLDSDGLGLTSVTGGFQTDDEINKTLTAITQATSQLRAQASTFGSNLSIVQNRQDFSKNLINILDTGAANLTNADLNEEAANSQALSTRQSIGISALSLANTAQQGILQLLR